jgi:hypothetical protein
MRTREELAWAGGLFEGEGCFSLNVQRKKARCVALLSSTDKECIERFVRSVGLGRVLGPYVHSRAASKPKYKQHWNWSISGFEDVQALLAMLWPWLSERRKTRAVEVLRATPLVRRRNKPRPWGKVCTEALN